MEIRLVQLHLGQQFSADVDETLRAKELGGMEIVESRLMWMRCCKSFALDFDAAPVLQQGWE